MRQKSSYKINRTKRQELKTYGKKGAREMKRSALSGSVRKRV